MLVYQEWHRFSTSNLGVLVMPEIPQVREDPRYVALAERLAALEERADSLHEQVAKVQAERRDEESGARMQRLARELAAGAPPGAMPRTPADLEREVAQLTEQLNATGAARELLSREQAGLVKVISGEVLTQLRPEYIALIGAIYQQALALVEALEREDEFVARLLGAGLDLQGFNRVTLPLSREDLEHLRRESVRHYATDPGQAGSPHAPAPGRKRQQAVAADQVVATPAG
jgi:hypothetical protein